MGNLSILCLSPYASWVRLQDKKSVSHFESMMTRVNGCVHANCARVVVHLQAYSSSAFDDNGLKYLDSQSWQLIPVYTESLG